MRARTQLFVLIGIALAGAPGIASAASDLNLNGISDDAEAEVVAATSTTLVPGEYHFNTLVIPSGITLTLAGAPESAADFKGVLLVADSLSIRDGARVSADRQGYTLQYPGPGTPSPTTLGGASHGGSTDDAHWYGSALYPRTLGSAANNGGPGGGAIEVRVHDVIVDGSLSADGARSASGGSILISADRVLGTGVIEANGGNFYADTVFHRPGAGGRIALYASDYEFSGVVSVAGGQDVFRDGSPLQFAEAGTAIWMNPTTDVATTFGRWRVQVNDGPRTYSALVIANGPVDVENGASLNANDLEISGAGALIFGDDTTLTADTVRVSGGGVLTLADTLVNRVHDFDIEPGGTVRAALMRTLHLLADTITVAPGGVISADQQGCTPSAQCPGTPDQQDQTTGASYGGRGYGPNAPPPYGDADHPSDLGSGSVYRFNGGGAIRLEAGLLALDGEIRASGGPSASGGSVWVTADTLSGSGSIAADGGDLDYSTVFIGSGAGGRVAVYYGDAADWSGALSAAGGRAVTIFPAPPPYAENGSVIFASNTPPAPAVLFIPGLEGSRLYQNANGTENKRWEPFLKSDVQALYLDPRGISINGVYTKADGTIAQIETPIGGGDIYQKFFDDLDQMRADGTISDWTSFPYDWRMNPEDVVENGTPYDDGVHSIVAAVEGLAQGGRKVVVVGHSNGGLVAKALVQKLEQLGESDLIKKIILVATPQLGTPQTIASMLHGDFEELPSHDFAHGLFAGWVVSQATARALGENMPAAYTLLPSAAYFAKVADPVVDLSAAPNLYSTAGVSATKITDPLALANFITGAGGRVKPIFSNVEAPNVLSSGLLADAVGAHTDLDSWTPPAGVDVVQVAGWGLDTPKSVIYSEDQSCLDVLCSVQTILHHSLGWTEDGDKTVVVASAAATSSWPTYYLNIHQLNEQLRTNFSHLDITEMQPFHDLLPILFSTSTTSSLPQYVSASLPSATSLGSRLRLRVLSPVSLDAYDSQGRHAGLALNPAPGSDLTYKEEQIPNSYYEEFGEGKYIGVPNEGTTTVVLQGLSSGTFTFEIIPVVAGVEGAPVVYRNIPVTASTTATATISPNAVASASLALDVNGDGRTDTMMASPSQTPDPLTYIRLIEATVQTMSMGATVKKQLLAKLENAEHLIRKDQKWNRADNDPIVTIILRKLNQVEIYVQKQSVGGGISQAQGTAIMNMLEYLKTLVKT